MRLRAILASFLAVTLLLSCGGGGGADTLRLGWFGPLTGDRAAEGLNELNTVRMLADEINRAGGVTVSGTAYTLKVVAVDTAGDPLKALDAARRLVNRDKVIAIIGPDSSNSAIPIAPILEQAMVPSIATAATNPKVTVVDGTVKPYNFRACFADPDQGATAAAYAYLVEGARRAAVIHDPGDEYSKGMRDAFVETFLRLGGTVVADGTFSPDHADLGSAIGSVVAVRPRFLFVPCLADDALAIVTGMREAGYGGTVMGGRDFRRIPADLPAMAGSFYLDHLHPGDPDLLEFRDRYLERWGSESGTVGFLAHDAVMLVLDALKRSEGATGEALAAALSASDIQGITGRIRIDPATHDPSGKDLAVIQSVDGTYAFKRKYSPEPGR